MKDMLLLILNLLFTRCKYIKHVFLFLILTEAPAWLGIFAHVGVDLGLQFGSINIVFGWICCIPVINKKYKNEAVGFAWELHYEKMPM